jgi:DNA-binding NarL/FixJ family response regulator
VVGEAADGRAAVALAARTRPRVVLMDIRMPEMNGITATARIVAQAAATPGPPPRVLVLTTFDLDEYVYAALRAGASGFLLKETTPERLIGAIHTVAEGDTLLAPGVTRRLVEAYAPREGRPAELAALTARETEILRLVATGQANPDIAAALFVSESTVKTHVNRLMAKLGLASRAQAVIAAYENGLVVPLQRSESPRRTDESAPAPGSLPVT